MQFIKNHYIGLILSVFILMFILLYAIVLFSPKKDLQGRGFIPCTEQIVDDITMCKKGINLCVVKAVLNGTKCDINVIAQGFRSWVNGEQPRPWSNYFFEPELYEADVANEDLKEYYEENPNIKLEMQNLRNLKNDV